MSSSIPDPVRGLIKFVAVLAFAVLVGVGLGTALSKASGDDNSAAVPLAPGANTGKTTTATSTATSGAPTTPAVTSVATSTAGLDLGNGVSLTVDDATYLPATTAAGKARKRARLTVIATVSNGGTVDATPAIDKLIVRVGGQVVRPDPRATDEAGALLQGVPAGGTAKGELHFETAGDATDALAKLTNVKLFYGPKTLTVPIT